MGSQGYYCFYLLLLFCVKGFGWCGGDYLVIVPFVSIILLCAAIFLLVVFPPDYLLLLFFSFHETVAYGIIYAVLLQLFLFFVPHLSFASLLAPLSSNFSTTSV